MHGRCRRVLGIAVAAVQVSDSEVNTRVSKVKACKVKPNSYFMVDSLKQTAWCMYLHDFAELDCDLTTRRLFCQAQVG